MFFPLTRLLFRNWNRFLSTNSEEMSKSMQFSFNDLKLRGFAGHNASIRTFAVNEPLKLFASGSRDRTVKIWSLDVHDGIEHWETDPFSESLVTYTGHKRSIHDLHFLSPGLNDVVASCDGHVHVSFFVYIIRTLYTDIFYTRFGIQTQV
jgi:WD40 repeat protein